MTHRKMKSRALTGLLLALVCCLSGCSFSFCGIPLGGKEELVFVCSEEGDARHSEQTASEDKATQSEPAVQPVSGTSGSGVTADGKVNINLATAEELMTLKGVGETRARAIVEYREKNGPFQNIEDIMLIPGIKEGIFSKIKEQIATQ